MGISSPKRASSNARVLAGMRQLCSLGLPPDIVVPKLLDALHRWVPAGSNHFIWSDARGLPNNYYGELSGVERYIGRFFRDFALTANPRLTPPYPEVVRRFDVQTMGIDNAAVFVESALYREVFRPLDGRFVLNCAVRGRDRPLGLLTLLRGPSDRPFDATEVESVRSVVPYLRHALDCTPRTGSAGDLAQRIDAQGMAVLDERGRILHMDAQARRLMFLATHPQANAESLGDCDPNGVPVCIARMCADLAAILGGRPARPPGFERANNWGRFVFRGNWLAGHGGEPPRVGLLIAHYLPRRLRLWQSIQVLELAPRLQEAALHYADGCSLSELAQRMGISRNTAISYVEALYEKLAIPPSKEALQDLLLGDLPGAAPR
jgi:DNA-binding CsgD family transcriptional regulator